MPLLVLLFNLLYPAPAQADNVRNAFIAQSINYSIETLLTQTRKQIVTTSRLVRDPALDSMSEEMIQCNSAKEILTHYCENKFTPERYKEHHRDGKDIEITFSPGGENPCAIPVETLANQVWELIQFSPEHYETFINSNWQRYGAAVGVSNAADTQSARYNECRLKITVSIHFSK